MKKSKVPTSNYQVFCDTFDMKLSTKIHEAGSRKEHKILITMESEDGNDKLSVSLFKEDVSALISVLTSLNQNVEPRNFKP